MAKPPFWIGVAAAAATPGLAESGGSKRKRLRGDPKSNAVFAPFSARNRICLFGRKALVRARGGCPLAAHGGSRETGSAGRREDERCQFQKETRVGAVNPKRSYYLI